MWAVMVDMEQSWDRLVRRHSPNDATREGLLHNELYQTLTTRFVQSHDYVAMERLYGRDLQQALADGWRPTVEQAMQLVRRVTEALAYAHARGVEDGDRSA